ncbi:MAG: rhomboid family intramembrane serine protease [Pseudoflavonifractor sp.]
MRSIDSRLDRFCYKHPKLSIPNLMKAIVIGNVLVYLLSLFGPPNINLAGLLSFSPDAILHHGQLWRLITFVFVPQDSNPFFLILSLYFYWWIGSTLEREWGSVKFTVFYGMGVLLNIVGGFLLYFIFPTKGITADISFVNLSLFFAFATLYPDMQVLLIIIPVKIKWLAWVDALLFAASTVSSLWSRNWIGALIPLIAMLNYLLFFWSDLTGFVHTKVRRVQHQTSRQTVNFKQATKQAQQQKGYIHKCAVCGKTDTDYPNEEFRYCSKCNGYYCYCSEHIANHVHIE